MRSKILYTKVQFGAFLKQLIQRQTNVVDIGKWSFSVYWENIRDMDSDFEDIALTLNTMERGPEFALSYEELDRIADDLIAGREVKFK